MGFDPKDPNRPRFTLQELRDVLHERNELKAKVFMLQEEIAYYKRSAVCVCHRQEYNLLFKANHKGGWRLKISCAPHFGFGYNVLLM